MMLALLTGLRQGDILALQLQSITDEGLHVQTSKTGRRLIFEWTPALRATIDQALQLRASAPSMFLFCGRSGHKYTANGFKAMWQRVIRKSWQAGLLNERFTFHDIRAKAGSDSKDGKLLGHENPQTLHRHYKRNAVRVTPLSS